MTAKILTQQRLKELLHYNHFSGLFTWKINKGSATNKSIAGYIAKPPERAYVRIAIDGANYLGHRLAWLYIYGALPINEIDHIDHNESNNRIKNLRNVNRQENSKNSSLSLANTSGVTGVCWRGMRRKWQAHIKVGGKFISLGCFSEKKDAVTARKSADLKYNFHQNHGT